MSESKTRKEFAKNLLAQDPPPIDEQLRRNEELFKKLKHRACLQKAVIIAIFMIIYFAAFGAFMLGRSTDNVIHSICWGTVSLHIMLWSLVYILRGNCMNMEELIEKKFDNNERHRYKNQNLFLTILAILLFIFNSIILYRSFFLVDSLQAAHKAVGILWAAIIFLICYSFYMASLIAILWFEHKKIELGITKPEEEKSETQLE
jgi:magnesium-transporting ATPase (P-type)